MTIQHENLDNASLVQVHGRLDQSQIVELEAVLTDLLDDGRSALIVDLSQTTYINSGGLRCLVSAWRKARQQNGDLVLYGLNERLQAMFAMVGFDKVFQLHSNLKAAQKALVHSTRSK